MEGQVCPDWDNVFAFGTFVVGFDFLLFQVDPYILLDLDMLSTFSTKRYINNIIIK